jgi:hypothetical protein
MMTKIRHVRTTRKAMTAKTIEKVRPGLAWRRSRGSAGSGGIFQYSLWSTKDKVLLDGRFHDIDTRTAGVERDLCGAE